MAALLVAAACAPALQAQALREVVVDVRVSSQALGPTLTGSSVVSSLTDRLRERAQFQFGYVKWVALGTATDPGAPRLVLRIFDGPEPDCGTPAVRFQILAEKDRGVQWEKLESDLSDPCDIGVADWSAEELVDRIMRTVKAQLDEPRTLDEIQGQLLSKVALAASLEPDATEQRLYLPLAGLQAGEGSVLVAKFGGVPDRILRMSPIEVRGGRTRVKLVGFSCDSIEFAGASPVDWSPLLPRLLETCLEPRIFMDVYRPDRSVETTSSGLRTNLDDEGEVQP